MREQFLATPFKQGNSWVVAIPLKIYNLHKKKMKKDIRITLSDAMTDDLGGDERGEYMRRVREDSL